MKLFVKSTDHEVVMKCTDHEVVMKCTDHEVVMKSTDDEAFNIKYFKLLLISSSLGTTLFKYSERIFFTECETRCQILCIYDRTLTEM